MSAIHQDFDFATMSTADKRSFLKQIPDNDVLRNWLAQSRAKLVNFELQEQSTIRAIFAVEDMPEGQASYQIPFDDIDCTFWLPGVGATPTVQLEGAEMLVGTFRLGGGIQIHEDILREGRVPMLQRATTLFKNKFIALEEIAGWGLIKQHAANLVSHQVFNALNAAGLPGAGNNTDGLFNIYTLNELLTRGDEIGVGGRKVVDIYMSPRRFNDIRNQVQNWNLPFALRLQLWGNGNGDSNPADVNIHKVYNPNLLDNTAAYAFTYKDGIRYGVMPIRQPVISRDDPSTLRDGFISWYGHERIGMGVLDSMSLIKIVF